MADSFTKAVESALSDFADICHDSIHEATAEALAAIQAAKAEMLEQTIVDFEQCRSTDEIDEMARIKRAKIRGEG